MIKLNSYWNKIQLMFTGTSSNIIKNQYVNLFNFSLRLQIVGASLFKKLGEELAYNLPVIFNNISVRALDTLLEKNHSNIKLPTKISLIFNNITNDVDLLMKYYKEQKDKTSTYKQKIQLLQFDTESEKWFKWKKNKTLDSDAEVSLIGQFIKTTDDSSFDKIKKHLNPLN